MSIEAKLLVSDIQRFCMHDGPGLRTTVFLKGCPLRCQWCHNPETQKNTRQLLYYESKCVGCGACGACTGDVHSFAPVHRLVREGCTVCGKCAELCPTRALEICGSEMTVTDILKEIKRDLPFYGQNGGITVSGGEPFMQASGVTELLKACKAEGISTAVETCGYGDGSAFAGAAPHTDLFLWDVKDTSPDRHRRFTGVSNETILKNLRSVDSMGGRTRLRCILVNGVNTDETHYRSVAELALSLLNCEGVEFIPYHPYGISKRIALGLEGEQMAEGGWIPTDGQIRAAKEILSDCGVRVF